MFRGAHRRGFLDNSGDAAQQRRMEDRLELRRQRREQGLQKRRKQQVRTTTRTHTLSFFSFFYMVFVHKKLRFSPIYVILLQTRDLIVQNSLKMFDIRNVWVDAPHSGAMEAVLENFLELYRGNAKIDL